MARPAEGMTDYSKAFETEYKRIGYRSGEYWPTPANVTDPKALIDLLRRVPDGTGLRGWLEVLRTAPETRESGPAV